MTASETITVEETQLYDRQIRIWGLDSQNKIRNAHIFVFGLDSLTGEVIKNLVLAGIGQITLHDNTKVIETHLGNEFFLREEDIHNKKSQAYAPRVRNLNPRVKVNVNETTMNAISSNLENVDIFCLSSRDPKLIDSLNSLCIKKGIKFFVCHNLGWNSFFFSGLGKVNYIKDEKIIKEVYPDFKTAISKLSWGNINKRAFKKIVSCFLFISVLKYQHKTQTSLTINDCDDVFSFTESLAKETQFKGEFHKGQVLCLLEKIDVEFTPVSAVVGGILSQEIIKTVCEKDPPLKNLFFFDGYNCVDCIVEIGK